LIFKKLYNTVKLSKVTIARTKEKERPNFIKEETPEQIYVTDRAAFDTAIMDLMVELSSL
jgi:hypothetical protein